MGNAIAYNPYENPYVGTNGVNGTLSEQLWYSAGHSAVFSQILLIFFIGSWMVVPVNWSMIYCFLKIGPIRSDMVFAAFWNFLLAGIFIAATGGYQGRTLFVWIKNYSVVAGCFQAWIFKYWTGFPNKTAFIMYSQSFIIHGVLVINILEAAIWEIAIIGKAPFNVINCISGFILGFSVVFYTYTYGVSVVEYFDGRLRQLRSNLTPTWILAYTLWNMEYNAVYHPMEASIFIFTTLIIPFCGAFWAGHDWLETRAYLLLHTINLRFLPYGGSGLITGTYGLWEDMYKSEAFNYLFSIAGLIVTLWSMYEAYCIHKGQKWFDYGMRKEFILFDMAEPYGHESVAPIIHKVLNLSPIHPPKVTWKVAGMFSKSPQRWKHWGDFLTRHKVDSTYEDDDEKKEKALASPTVNPTFEDKA